MVPKGEPPLTHTTSHSLKLRGNPVLGKVLVLQLLKVPDCHKGTNELKLKTKQYVNKVYKPEMDETHFLSYFLA